MNKTLTKVLATSIAAVALTATLAGCGKGSASSSTEGSGEIALWTHNAGNPEELAAVQKIVDSYNGSQDKVKIKVQAFPQDSYNDAVVSAAAAGKLPCIVDIDGPNVPNWAWAGYLAPLDGLDATLSKYLPTVLGKYNNKTYSYGYYDVALVMVTRKTILDKYG